MPGESAVPEPLPAGGDLPAQEPEAASPPGPSQPVVPPRGAPPAGAGQAIWPEPAGRAAGAWGAVEPADAGAWAPPSPPSPPGSPLDPAAVTGPPWPRLVAADGAYTPPRLIRWPIVVGIVLFAGWIAAAVALPSAPASSPGSASAYVLAASDAHFTATFPVKPQRTVKTVGTITVIGYTAEVSGHAVDVTYFQLPASGSVSLDGAINGAASALPGGKVVSRGSLTCQGQPAEDGVISSSVGFSQVRVVSLGSSVYIFEGVGSTVSGFAHDYKVLLDSFTPHHP